MKTTEQEKKQKQADEKTLKKFAEAFAKLRAKYPEIEAWAFGFEF